MITVVKEPLKYVATINDETLAEGTHPCYEIDYVDIGNIAKTGEIIDTAQYQFEDAPSRARRIVRDGDVIISTVRTYLKAIALIKSPPENLIVSTGFAVVRPVQKKLDANFCEYALRNSEFIGEVILRSVGVSYPAINASDLADIEIHVPPLAQQRRIADYLNRETAKLDALIAAKQRLLTLLAEKRRAMITQAVTCGVRGDVPMKDSGIEWLGEVPKDWETIPLRRFVRSIEQGWSPQADDKEPDDDEWGVLKLNAIRNGQFDSSKSKTIPSNLEIPHNLEVEAGDFLLTRANTPDLVGDVCYVEETKPHLILSDLVYRLQLQEDQLDGRFLSYFLQSPIGRLQIKTDARGSSSSMVKLSQGHILDWLLLMPSLDEQQQIVVHIDSKIKEIDNLAKTTSQAIALLQERRTAAISAAVTGQLDIAA